MKGQTNSMKRVTITINHDHGEALRLLAVVNHKSLQELADEIFGKSEIIKLGTELLRSTRRSEPTCTPEKLPAALPRATYSEMPEVNFRRIESSTSDEQPDY